MNLRQTTHPCPETPQSISHPYNKLFQNIFLILSSSRRFLPILPEISAEVNTMAIWKVRGLAVVRRCYAEGDGDLHQVVVVEVT
jgi:hypothetical protein